MTKKKFVVIIAIILIFSFSISTIASGGWNPIYSKTILGIWRVEISPPHYGYAGPQIGNIMHQNYVLYTNGAESLNLHLYKPSQYCFAGWESHTGAYAKYCNSSNPKAAAKSVLDSIDAKFRDLSSYIELAAVIAALATFFKIIWEWIVANWQLVYAL